MARETFFFAIICVLASADHTSDNNTACIITCGDNYTQCHDSIIDASFAANLTLYCPYPNSCRNTTTVCPIGTNTKCVVSCTGSFSCDNSIIHSRSTETTLNCVSPNITTTNICTNINVFSNTKKLDVHCTGNNVTVCDDITVSANVSNAYHDTSISFKCFGNNIHCDSINISAPNIDKLRVFVDGTMSNLNNCMFVNNNDMDIEINGGSLISMSSFTMNYGKAVSVLMTNDSICRSNEFILRNYDAFDFKMINTDTSTSALLTDTNITIVNDGPMMSLEFLIENINGDGTNHIIAQKVDRFALKCRNNDTNCGNIGIIEVHFAWEVLILIDNNVTFKSVLNTTHVMNLNITVLKGGIVDGLMVDVDVGVRIEGLSAYVYFHVYGETRGTNVINAPVASSLDVFCGNPGSCNDDLKLYISPHATNIKCVGTGCDRMTFIVTNSTKEFAVDMTNCACYNVRRTLCITEWNILCDGNKTSTIADKKCTGDCCGEIMSQLEPKYDDKYECPLSNNATTYICREDEACTVDCRNVTQYDEKSAFLCSSNGVIDASMSQSLNMLCHEGKASCNGLKVLCPIANNTNAQCTINCTETASCSRLEIEILHNIDVMLHCLDNASCTNIIINSAIASTSKSGLNTVTIACSDGLCKDINIMDKTRDDVWFKFTNITYDGINITSHLGEMMLSMMGISSVFTNCTIYGDKVTITGDEYVFKDNNITLLSQESILKVEGNMSAVFESNTLIEHESGNEYMISVKGNNEISFHQMSEKLMFVASDTIVITIKANQSLTNKSVVVMNPMAELSIHVLDWAMLQNVTFDIKEINSFRYECTGLCFDNKIMADNVSSLYLMAISEINGDNTEINAYNVETLTLNVNRNGNLTNLYFDPMRLKSVFVNVSGTLSNVSINASKSNYLSVICSHQCENITLFVPVSINATASLLCRHESCQNLTFYTRNNMDDIDVLLTHCPCDLAVKSSCIPSGSQWDIYCDDNDTVASVFAMNKCDGVCCGDIVQDLRKKECYGGVSKAVIIGCICGGVVVLAIIGGVMFYFHKKKKAKEEALLFVEQSKE